MFRAWELPIFAVIVPLPTYAPERVRRALALGSSLFPKDEILADALSSLRCARHRNRELLSVVRKDPSIPVSDLFVAFVDRFDRVSINELQCYGIVTGVRYGVVLPVEFRFVSELTRVPNAALPVWCDLENQPLP